MDLTQIRDSEKPFLKSLREDIKSYFENVVYRVLTEHTAYQIGKKPKFNCHFGLNREGDFEIIMSNRKIHLECKQ